MLAREIWLQLDIILYVSALCASATHYSSSLMTYLLTVVGGDCGSPVMFIAVWVYFVATCYYLDFQVFFVLKMEKKCCRS
jgi:hypothetical protein